MDILPKDIINIIISLLPIESVLSLSETNKYYNIICNNNNFWKHRLGNDVSIIITDDAINWKDEYMNILRNKIRYKPIYCRRIYIDYIRFTETDNMLDVFNTILNKYNVLYPTNHEYRFQLFLMRNDMTHCKIYNSVNKMTFHNGIRTIGNKYIWDTKEFNLKII